MVDESETAPLPDPVSEPAPAALPVATPPAAAGVETAVTPVFAPAPEPAAAVAPAPAAPAVAPAAAIAAAPAAPSRRNRMLGLTAETAGVIGIFLFVALAMVVLLGRGWATSTVDDLSGSVDAKMAQAVPLLDNASTKVSEINGRIGALTDAATSLAAQADAAPGLLGGLRDQLSNLQNRYLEFRATYADVRQTAVTALDSLRVMSRLIPGFSVPQDAVDTLAALDAKVQDIDAKIMDVSNALTDGPVQAVANVVVTKAAAVQDGLSKLTTALNGAQARLAEVRSQVASTADTVNMFISIGSILLFLLFLYFALLHWVLFRTGRGLRKAPAAG